jgi:hypothetical protein
MMDQLRFLAALSLEKIGKSECFYPFFPLQKDLPLADKDSDTPFRGVNAHKELPIVQFVFRFLSHIDRRNAPVQSLERGICGI